MLKLQNESNMKQVTKQVTVINIAWEKIAFDYSFETIKHIEGKGIYQIYGHHPAYGQEALLYIGEAKNSFKQRLDNRREFIESCAVPAHIRLGRLLRPDNPNDKLEWDINRWESGELISKVEEMLICAHAPAFNKQNNAGLYVAGLEEHVLVLNWGDRGSLVPEVSTLRYSYEYWNYDTNA